MGYLPGQRGVAADCNLSILTRGRKAMEGMMPSQREHTEWSEVMSHDRARSGAARARWLNPISLRRWLVEPMRSLVGSGTVGVGQAALR